MSAINTPSGATMVAYRKDPEHVQLMSRQAYNDLRGWTVPEGEDPNDMGYLIRGTDPNSTRMSWMVREQFEEAYQLVLDAKPGTDPDWVLRLRAERTQLTKRIDGLLAMIRSPNFAKIDANIQNALKAQRMGMEGLREILNYRIGHYDEVIAAAKTPDKKE